MKHAIRAKQRANKKREEIVKPLPKKAAVPKKKTNIRDALKKSTSKKASKKSDK